MSCPFCNIEELNPRIFYCENNWIGFLAVPYHVKGHAILSALTIKNHCPRKLEDTNYAKLGEALIIVGGAVRRHYNSKDVLYVSVRGDIKHFHIHIIPLYKQQEKQWRLEKLYAKGHLFEFLGYLECIGDTKALQERIKNNRDKEQQRSAIIKQIKRAGHIEKLKEEVKKSIKHCSDDH